MKHFKDLTELELRGVMQSCAHAVETAVKLHGVETPKVALLIFNDIHSVQYVSNCDRRDMIAALRESANRMEAREDVPRD